MNCDIKIVKTEPYFINLVKGDEVQKHQKQLKCSILCWNRYFSCALIVTIHYIFFRVKKAFEEKNGRVWFR